MTEKKDTLIPLRDILSTIVKNGNLPINASDAQIWTTWEEAVGKAIAGHASPSWFRKGCLRVIVTDSIWLQELEYVKETIIDKINKKLGKKVVEQIDFRFGSL
jgi:predicted nucleic acid-binding Zn ribbon protein